MSYSEKLLDPRWQRKRLEILTRDNFCCVWCCNDKETLHVHHLNYAGDPWDVPDEFLITICHSCHQDEHNLRPASEKELLKQFKIKEFSHHHILEISEGLRDFAPFHHPDVMASVIAWAFRNDRIMSYLSNEYFASLSKGRVLSENIDLPF